jgi:mono/diheme cytochrome c family protein
MRHLLLLGVGSIVVAGVPGSCATFPVKYEPGKVPFQVEVTPERVARGKVIASLLCADCHYDSATGGFTGRLMGDSPPDFGVLYSKNITRHATRGIGGWTDGELAYLLRTGIERDGTFTGPFMAHPRSSDEDIAAMIAFLRSDDPWVAPRDNENRPSQPSFLYRMLMNFAWKPFLYPKTPIEAPSPTDRIAYGRYLATDLLDCHGCHSESFRTIDFVHPEKTAGFFGGGNKLRDGAGNAVYSANITFDAETGIGSWSEAQFVRALREGVRPDNRPIRFPMDWMPELTPDDAAAIYAYLRTVPVIHNRLDRWQENAAPAAVATSGEKLFYKFYCTSCHGSNGAGTVCDLRGAYVKYKTRDQVMAFIKNASAFVPGTKMPTWSGVIEEDDYGPLADYVKLLADAAPATAH